ncbi:MAG: hypothetical protein JO280_13745, partial [Mycobacteriaceae bacterium]|nr:hypothetical protein [Mycobacteriaceae bacterium]
MTAESAAAAAPSTTQSDIAGTVGRLRRTFASGRTRNVDWRKDQLL